MFNRFALCSVALFVACGSKSPSTSTSSQTAEPLSNSVPTDAPPATTPNEAGLRLTGIEPEHGDTAGGTYVIIKGEGFLKDGPRNAKVYFGSAQGAVVRFQSDRELIVEAPGGKSNEVVDVRVVFDPGGELYVRGAFKFVDRPTP